MTKNTDVKEKMNMDVVLDARKDFNSFDDIPKSIVSSINEEFRAIKRTLLNVAFEQGESQPKRNRVMITSINACEGKTFTAIGLAKSVSTERNKTVLLVDGDVLNPSISEMLTPSPSYGLMDYLNDPDIEVPQVMCNTQNEGLKIITHGSGHHHANELLSSDLMNNLMHEFNTRYSDRLVVIDSPPIMGVNETLTMAAKVDQIVIVIEEGKTKVSELKRIQRALPKNVIVHFLLNKTLSQTEWINYNGVQDKINPNDQVLTGASALN
jgi:protein-tyrosine kinase